ncbi:multidrug transporter [Pseudomonas sp. 681]|uniref:Multidrug transporter n=1 Tax=Pseudomonas fungipugnans TaxID=3024217 RepID=A0ABT6QNT5_9PSED|nr:multidrug transporter [Pseudomonas sp. 681]MDI2592552.1 multidrug transporter [Pseudomonas sp. 681]
MNLFRTFAVAVLLCVALPTLAADNNGSGDPRYAIQNPPAYAMIGDLLIARPLLVVATVIGAGVFVVSLPFTALGGGVGDAGQALVVAPAKAAFVRCLGCTGEGFEDRE